MSDHDTASDLTSEDLHRFLTDQERELDLFDVKIDGVYIWERIRRTVFFDIRRQVLNLDSPHPPPEINLRNVLHSLDQFLRSSFRRNPFLSESNDILVYGHGRRKRLEGDQYWDIYTDHLFLNSDYSYSQVEKPYKLSHKKPARTPDLKYLDWIYYPEMFFENITSKLLYNVNNERFRVMESRIKNELRVDISLEAAAERELSRRKGSYRLYNTLLNRIDPSVVVLVVSPTKNTLIELCKSKEIPVIELQHGVMNKYHYGYSYPPGVEVTTFPDHLFTYGTYWTKDFHLPTPEENIHPVGYAHLDYYRDKFGSSSNESGNIIFISQGHISSELAELAIDVQKETAFSVIYKLHPTEPIKRSEFDKLADAGGVIVEGEQVIYELFAQCEAQVGVSSTAIYEGLAFDLDTYIFDTATSDTLKDLVNSGHAELIESASDIRKQSSQSINLDREIFFRPNAKENFSRELDSILKDQ